MTESNSITQLFEFLEKSDLFQVEKYEVHSTKFSVLRRSLRRMIVLLREEGDDEGGPLSDRLRALLSRWLTTPVEFDYNLSDSLEATGAGAGFENRWGTQIATAYREACGAARELAEVNNPLRKKLEEIVEGLRRGGDSFRIYCHRSAVVDFQSLKSPSGEEVSAKEIFLHTPRDYRHSNTFDVLVKVGPLRSRGWGAVPDAFLTAPRFNKLVQFVWAGCQDEPDFGYDPANVSEEIRGANDPKSFEGFIWQTTTTQTGDDPSVSTLTSDEDDFRLLSDFGHAVDIRRCFLAQFGQQQGALYSPRGDVLSYDPSAGSEGALKFRTVGDGLSEGMFVIEDLFHDTGTCGAQAEEGKYSKIWKQAIWDKMLFDDNFENKLCDDGISLIHLHQSLLQWRKPATSVVHAPQRRRHFQILIRNLDIDQSQHKSESWNRIPWWMAAWNEVIKTRGEAIQTGMHEHRAADDQLVKFLESRLMEIQEKSATNPESFYLTIPRENELPGRIEFHKITAIEAGFRTPDGNLRTICDLEEIEQWRE